ncbi:MAG: type I phosphomannose isomerase catalytic subunit [Planctomycetaceae bacterium]
MLPPLILSPIYRRYLWGGRRFEAAFGRRLSEPGPYAESWQLVDRGEDQSVVAAGPLVGTPLRAVVQTQGRDLLGRHAPLAAFPLLFKFLDACQDLSVQVHPDDARAAALGTPDLGKTEAWYVIDAVPGSRIYAGLREGVTRDRLAEALRAGRCDEVIHAFPVRAGDCVFIPAGTVHAIGAGLLVAEIQQSSDVTFRLHDWHRVGPDGRPRALHVEEGLEATTRRGPVAPVTRMPTADPAVMRLVACDYFVFDEVRPRGAWLVGGDDACHFVAVVSGQVDLEDRWNLPPLGPGDAVLLPASAGRQSLTATDDATLLRVTLP